VDGTIHRGNRREVDNLHLSLEVGAAHNLARCVGVHAEYLTVAQVQHIAAVQLHPPHMNASNQRATHTQRCCWKILAGAWYISDHGGQASFLLS
jgi:hypothetical protein